MDFEWLWYIKIASPLVKKKAYLLNDNNNGGSYARFGTGSLWEISLPSQFCCKSRTTIRKMKPFLKICRI